jgi:hypothetical protein
MLYKVTMTGHRGKENVVYMDEKTLKSMTNDSIVNVEKVKRKPPNKNDDDWRYHRRVF